MTYSSTQSLRRPLEGRMLAGVCAGLARYFNLDVTLVRIGWVLFTLLGGSGILAYVIAWALIPDDSGQRTSTPLAILIVFVALGLLPFLCALFMIPVRVVTG
jgi:phage shock protein C